MNPSRGLFIKICGLRSASDVHAAINAGADAIGFVFAPSVRQVTALQAASLTVGLRDRIKVIAVTRSPNQDQIDEIAEVLQPDYLQSDWQDFTHLRLPKEIPALPVFRDGDEQPPYLPSPYLYEGVHSGTGLVANWAVAASWARTSDLILAGGLHPENVAQAILAVSPRGVDVSSGVESSPGVKDSRLIEAFIFRAREAARTLSGELT